MSSRTLYSLAVSGNAPSIFTRCNRWGVPYIAVIVCSMFALLAYLNAGNNTSAVFNWLINLTNTAGFTSWVCCSIIFLRFRKACDVQRIEKSRLPYQSRLQPWMAWICMVILTILCLCNGFSVFFSGHWSVSSFLTAYLGLPIFLGIYFGHRLYAYKHPWAFRAEDIDLYSGADEASTVLGEDNASQGSTGPRWVEKVSALWR